MKQTSRFSPRTLVATALFAALSILLFQFKIKPPFIPSFLSFDFSDLPALLASFSLGPLSGLAVCLAKNLIGLIGTNSNGVGELSNFILSASFVLPAGLLYGRNKTKKNALLGALAGAFLMAAVCWPSNFFVVYPVYFKLFAPEPVILRAYQAILPGTKSIAQGILMVNVPFTLCKGLASLLLCLPVYKRLSPLIKGNQKNG